MNFIQSFTQKSITNKSKTGSSSHYILRKVLGRGAFGTVYLAYKNGEDGNENGSECAIKSTYQDMKYKNREGSILKMLSHPGIVKIFDIFYNKKKSKTYLNIVMEYFPVNLHQLIESKYDQQQRLEYTDIKWYSLQLFRTVGYLETLNLCHRDIKPQNILVNHPKRVIKVCDFGSAKRLSSSESNKHYICSRFYRAPELLLKSTHYDCAVDLWSVGCCMAEMYLSHPLFNGSNTNNQIHLIMNVLGDVPRNYPSGKYTDYSVNIGMATVDEWKEVLKIEKNATKLDYPTSGGSEDLKFLRLMLQFDPAKRLNLKQTLNHAYFEEFVFGTNRRKQNDHVRYPDPQWTEHELLIIDALQKER